MKRHEIARALLSLLVAAVVATVALVAASARDGNLNIPNGMQEIGGIYKASPESLSDGAIRTLHLDSIGNLKVTLVGSTGLVFRANTYDYALNFTPAVGVAVQVQGSATKTVRVKQTVINPGSTATFTFKICSSAATGGTGTTVTAGQHDSTQAAPTAVVTQYTVAPAAGTTIANLEPTLKLGSSNFGTITTGDNGTTEWTLNGSGQFLTITTDTSVAVIGGITITEE